MPRPRLFPGNYVRILRLRVRIVDRKPADFTIDDAHSNLGNARHGLALLWEQLLLAGLLQ
jgi:hypothetical protein